MKHGYFYYFIDLLKIFFRRQVDNFFFQRIDDVSFISLFFQELELNFLYDVIIHYKVQRELFCLYFSQFILFQNNTEDRAKYKLIQVENNNRIL
tara:strand:- start:319 stop:600 length:282 start_codon:yes stop_codon:yes gene_type:complete